MQLDLTRYRQPLSRFDRTFEPGEVAQAGDSYAIVAPVELEFDLHKDKAAFRLEGRTRTVLELECSRCLEPFRMPVDAPFDLRYLPADAMSADAETVVGEEDLETSFYRDDCLDLNELLREQFHLALPMKPLCDAGCRGLCSHCGANLNQAPCGCAATWTDPRLDALGAIRRTRV
jgi:uncharacterized protein